LPGINGLPTARETAVICLALHRGWPVAAGLQDLSDPVRKLLAGFVGRSLAGRMQLVGDFYLSLSGADREEFAISAPATLEGDTQAAFLMGVALAFAAVRRARFESTLE
jgi:hypothetical protein